MFQVWGRIVGAMVVLIVIAFLAQWILPRGKSKQTQRRQYLRRDIAPMIGFFGILIIGLSFAEAMRQAVIPAWGWGIVSGAFASFSLWVAWNYRNDQSSTQNSVGHYLRRLGVPVAVILIGTVLAIRIFGAALQVFVAGVLGVATMTLALFLFAKNVPSREQ